jgi:hypothetical protein
LKVSSISNLISLFWLNCFEGLPKEQKSAVENLIPTKLNSLRVRPSYLSSSPDHLFGTVHEMDLPKNADIKPPKGLV